MTKVTNDRVRETFENWHRQLLREVLGATDAQIENGEFADFTIVALRDLESARWRKENGIPELTEDQQRLIDLMSDISEEAVCAGWATETEYRLWAMLVERDDSHVYARAEVTPEQIAEMQRLSELIGGWIEYVAGDSVERGGWGERFVPLDAWLPRFKAWREKYPGVLS